MIILYGSESGTAQDFAEQTWQTFHRNGTKIVAKCMPFDDFQIAQLSDEKMAIFIISTSGQGEVPTNMRKNWRYLLSRKLSAQWLSNLHFAVLALGDSSYQKYNFAGKKLYRRLLQLGAKPVMELALADEQHTLGVDEVFEKWLPELVEIVKKLPASNLDENAQNVKTQKFLVEFAPSNLANSSQYHPISVVANDRLTDQTHFQDTRLITLATRPFESELSYSPGDVLMVLPENIPQSVRIAIEALDQCRHRLDEPFHICRTSSNVPLRPQFSRFFSSDAPLTLRDCLCFYFDLQSVPKRSFLRALAKCSPSELERDRLMELCSPEGIDDFLDYCQHPRRTLAELLRDFPNTASRLGPSELFDFFPVIRPRAFSIASSPTAHPGQIQILVARVEYAVKKMASLRFGLCSNFLCTRQIGAKVYVRIRPGLFKYHRNGVDGSGCGPLLLVGPGTGVAPHRSIVAENEAAADDDGHSSSITLFFGCRGAQRDFYFKNEWSNCAKATVVTAFSRDEPGKKVYVQHKILEHSAAVCRLLEQNDCRVFIAGSAGAMPQAVVAALKEALRTVRNVTEGEADERIERMERSGRIVYETWS
ncbi:hypothetical protein niasHS_018113 [Heterodera schachtii]|uniref:NADPH-dependent diflavin oxidoreductase 1 n=2 Tax=Heterodera TaxID=34509 RepID=A0ABD2HT55_HETSC